MRLSVVTLLISIAVCRAAALGAGADESMIGSIKQRLSRLDGLRVEYVSREKSTPPPWLLERLPAEIRSNTKFENSETSYQCVFRYLTGSGMFDMTTSAADQKVALEAKRPIVVRRVVVVRPDRAEDLVLQAGAKVAVGSITRSVEIPPLWYVDLSLGLRLYDSNRYLRADDVDRFQVVERTDRVVVVETQESGRRHHWSFDITDYRLLKYEVFDRKGDLFLAIESSDFELNGDVMLPRRITSKGLMLDEKRSPYVSHIFTADVQHYELSRPSEPRSPLTIQWPKGSTILDDRLKVQLTVGSADRTYSDSEIDEEMRRRDSEGKQLLQDAQKLIDEAQRGK